jgi:tRNA(Ile)-lysidine synthase
MTCNNAIIFIIMLMRASIILQQYCNFDSQKPLLLGVSGGPDSLVMLDLTLKLGYNLVAAHLNHGLREEAAFEEKKVGKFAMDRQVDFVAGRADVAGYARENMLSLEEAARVLRYRFLYNQAQALNAQAVLVAHNADDQVETVLMHFLRGAGLSGLKGMEPCLLPNPWSDSIPLVRPLLQVWREEIIEYCNVHNLVPSFDPTNQDTRIYRNRLRHELIPYLESYNPRVRPLILKTAEIISADHEVLEKATELAWQRCFIQRGEGYMALKTGALFDELLGIQRRIVRKAVSWLRPGLRDIDFGLVERALQAMGQGPGSSRQDLGGGLFVLVEDERAWFGVWEGHLPGDGWPQVPRLGSSCLPLNLSVSARQTLEGGWELLASPAIEVEPNSAEIYTNRDPYQAWLDLEQLELPLQIRCRQAGDRFTPLGMEGYSQKLSDFMINQKMPLRARQAWPLVFSGAELAWLPGYRLAHPFRVRPETRRVVHLRLIKRPQEKE